MATISDSRTCEKCGRPEGEHTGPAKTIPGVCDGYRGFTDDPL